MATVTAFTAARMLEIEASSVTGGLVDPQGNLLLSTRGGDEINAEVFVVRKVLDHRVRLQCLRVPRLRRVGTFVTEVLLVAFVYPDLFAAIGTTYGAGVVLTPLISPISKDASR
jgi:hypothetical protein